MSARKLVGSALHPAGHHSGWLANALFTSAQMSEADRLTVLHGIDSPTLMENAGRPLAEAIMERWKTPLPTIILCGPGNNGGDGFVAARYLKAAQWPVRIALFGDRDKLKGDAAHHAALWSGEVEVMSPACLDGAQLVVDSIFGAGLSRPLGGAAAETLTAASARRLPIVAVDVPSGLDGDTGENKGAVPCVFTLTCFRKKPGHLLQPGRHLCGDIQLVDIGTPESVFETIPIKTFANHPSLWSHAIPALHLDDVHSEFNSNFNKYHRGHALVWGGWPTSGAARMAALSAARIGAGLTTVAVDASVDSAAIGVYAASLQSVMIKPIREHADLQPLLFDTRITSMLIGPGAGVSSETRHRVLEVLRTGKALVLDADALSSFQGCPSELFDAISGPCVLTPHEGEFNRLFGKLECDKLSRARAAAKASNAVVIYKGSDTVIASPDGRVIINDNAPPTLATAGSGDILAGLVAGLLAQGVDAFLAAAAAVWIHGAAATHFGPGLIADDLPACIPAVLRQLLMPAPDTNPPAGREADASSKL